MHVHVHKFLWLFIERRIIDITESAASRSRWVLHTRLNLTRVRFRFPTFILSSWINCAWITISNWIVAVSRRTDISVEISRCIVRYIRIAFPNTPVPKPLGWIGRQQCTPFIRWMQVGPLCFFFFFFFQEDKKRKVRFIIPPRIFLCADHMILTIFLHQPSHEFNTRIRVWMRARARIVSFARLFVVHCFEARCHFAMTVTSRCLKRFSWR